MTANGSRIVDQVIRYMLSARATDRPSVCVQIMHALAVWLWKHDPKHARDATKHLADEIGGLK